MYGSFDAHLIYGWCENDRENSINDEWLDENNVTRYALDVVRYHIGESVYGVKCDVDKTTGIPTVDEEDKKIVQNAHAKSGSVEKIGFHLAMGGDYESQHITYTPAEPTVVVEDSPLRDSKRTRR